MPSSVWSGHLTFGLISMPVRLFSGARSQGISFNMLHRADKSRLKQQYVCQADGQVVDRSEIVKGYEFRKDEYIIIEPDEIKKIEPQTAKTSFDLTTYRITFKALVQLSGGVPGPATLGEYIRPAAAALQGTCNHILRMA